MSSYGIDSNPLRMSARYVPGLSRMAVFVDTGFEVDAPFRVTGVDRLFGVRSGSFGSDRYPFVWSYAI